VAEKPARRGAADTPSSSKPPVSFGPYRVILTATAQATYEQMFERSLAAEANNALTRNHVLEFRLVDDAIRRLIPANPGDKNYALADPLVGLFRMQRGRTRICWMIRPHNRLVLILFLADAPKSEADIDDPNKVLSHLVKAGYYKSDIEEWQRLTEPAPDATVQ
jgi:hypothetical protein